MRGSTASAAHLTPGGHSNNKSTTTNWEGEGEEREERKGWKVEERTAREERAGEE